MANLKGSERAQYVQGMFARIASRYDLMNRIMTLGQDVRWRAEVIRRAALKPGEMVLDLGAGTGDLAGEALRRLPQCRVVAADFTLAMMQAGKQRPGAVSIDWSGADAQNLPFPDQVFDAVVSGFLLRNVSDLTASLREQHRVLRPGGRMVALDTTRPPQSLLSPLINFHLHTMIPWLGRLVAGDSDAYTYLPDSTAGFLTAEQLASRMAAAGFHQVGFKRLMFGTIAIHWGIK
jgi:demethylmenaquinone methyltransferase/2-methoxy-6-polyprenyl-1,4-benzoquinol methylase